MRLTPTERDRLLLFSAAELARTRKARGLLLNVPEATAIIADTAAEAARDGKRLVEAAAAGRSVLTLDDVLPGVANIVTEVKVEAVFDDGTRLIVIRAPFGPPGSPGSRGSAGSPTTGDYVIPGEVVATGSRDLAAPAIVLSVTNTSDVPVSITSHFHFFEINSRLQFDRGAAYGMRLAIAAGASLRFDPGVPTDAPLTPIGGDRVAIGFAGLVDGPLDADGSKDRALARAREQGYLGVD